MRYTVRYTKRSFLKNRVDIKNIDKEGIETIAGSYQKNVLPGTVIRWRIKLNGATQQYKISMKQKELDELVQDMSFFDDNGKVIETANPRNANDPFFKHKDLNILFEGGTATLDDENAKDKFFLKCFKQDREFYFVDEDENGNIGRSGLVKYTVTKAGTETKLANKNIDEVLEAAQLLKEMSFEKQCQILSSFGVTMKNPDPAIVKNTLYTKISDKKDVLFGSKRSIEKFLELARAHSSELNLRTIITEALGKGIIFKKSGNIYKFGEVTLGKSMDAAYDYLSDPENTDIRDQIIVLNKK